MLKELRALVDVARMPATLYSAGAVPDASDSAVIVVPGFGAGDGWTAPLRRFLERSGYVVEPWGLGRNLGGLDLAHSLDDLSENWQVTPKQPYRGEAGVPFLAERLADRVRDRHAVLGRPVALVGWSLGGYLAREAARDLPDIVDRVITLGSPIVGGPKYTATGSRLAARGLDLDWIEREVRKREDRPIVQPITAVYSKTDAIVSWPAAIDRYNPRVRHVHLDCSHLGMIFNPSVWRTVLEALDGRSGLHAETDSLENCNGQRAVPGPIR